MQSSNLNCVNKLTPLPRIKAYDFEFNEKQANEALIRAQ
jgi:hypothetical protein